MNDFSQKSGGAETYLYNLIDMLKEKGHNVKTYFSGNKPKLSLFDSIFSIKNLIKSYKIMKEFSPDIVHIHKYNLSLSTSPLISAASLKKKAIVTFHDFGLLCSNGWCVDNQGAICEDPSSIKWVFRRSLSNKSFENRLYDYIKNKVHIHMIRKFAYLCIGPSKAITAFLKKESKTALHVPYFISGDWKFREKTAINNKLLFIGRLEKEKGLEHLIIALQFVDKKISLDIIGEGPEEKNIKKLIKKLDLKNKINFLGNVSNKNIQKYCHDADILVMPSIWMEQFGIVGIEAMASGLPAIASDTGGVSEWLKDGENGYLVPPGNPKKIADAVNNLISDLKKIKKFSKKGRELFLKEFTKESHYEKLMKVYETAK